MADVAFSDLTELTSLASADLICATDDSEAAAEKSKKVQLSTLRDWLIITGQYLRPQFTWKDADEIYIGGALYDVNGKYSGWTSQLTKSFSGLSASTFYYVYLDYSAITSGTAITATEIIYSTTAPTYSHSLRAPYNGNDRCIFGFKTDGSGNIPEFFHDGGDYLVFADQVTDLNPTDIDTTWTDVTLSIPAFATKANVFMEQNSAGSLRYYWRTNGQSGTTGHTVFGSSEAADGGSSHIVITDSSQIIEVKCSASGNDTIGVWTNGWYFPAGM